MPKTGDVEDQRRAQRKCEKWWFGTFFIFPYIGNVIIPTDELHHFSEGLKPPTSSSGVVNQHSIIGVVIHDIIDK